MRLIIRRPRHVRHPALRVTRIVVGILLIVASPLAIFVPFLLGVVPVFAGLSLLAPESRLARRCLMSSRLRLRTWRRSRRQSGA